MLSGPGGQYHAPYRYYNPKNARWNMPDPLGFVDGLNRYAYVAGNPVMYLDPLGLTLFDDGNPAGAFCNGAMDGALQLLDVANPFGSPLEALDLYNPNDPGMQAGRVAAEVGVTAASLAAGGFRYASLTLREWRFYVNPISPLPSFIPYQSGRHPASPVPLGLSPTPKDQAGKMPTGIGNTKICCCWHETESAYSI